MTALIAWRAARSVARSGAATRASGSAWCMDLAAHRDEDRLVRLDRAHDVVAGDVGGGHDDHRRPVEGRVDLEGDERGVRVGRADRGAVPGAREDEVVGVLGRAGELGRSLATQRRGSPRATGRERPGLDDDGAGGLGPRRQIGQRPSSMAVDSITGHDLAVTGRTPSAPHVTGPARTARVVAAQHRQVVPAAPGTSAIGGPPPYHPRAVASTPRAGIIDTESA